MSRHISHLSQSEQNLLQFNCTFPYPPPDQYLKRVNKSLTYEAPQVVESSFRDVVSVLICVLCCFAISPLRDRISACLEGQCTLSYVKSTRCFDQCVCVYVTLTSVVIGAQTDGSVFYSLWFWLQLWMLFEVCGNKVVACKPIPLPSPSLPINYVVCFGFFGVSAH